MTETLRIDDFSRGVTDNYVNGPLSAAQRMDNFLLTKNRKLISRYGSELFDSDLYQNPNGVARVGNLKYFESILFERVGKTVYYRSGAAWNHLVGPVTSNEVFGSGTAASHCSFADWQKHLYCTIDSYSTPRKIYHNGTSWQVRTAGLPALASSPTITPESADGKSYIYYFHYYYEYYVGTVLHIDRGPVTQVLVSNGGNFTSSSHGNDISGIPVISNGTTECYDTASIKVKIYRTTDAGTIGKYVGEVTNGTTTFEDDVADASLGSSVYITGGVVDNNPPPLAKYVIIVNDIGWFLNIKEGNEQKSFRIRQSKQFDIDSCPSSFYIDVDDEITGGSNVDIYPIIFTKNKTYRLEGYFDLLGRGGIRKRLISDSAGCVSHNSIIRTPRGIFFAALDGFYFCDGFNVQKLSDHLNDSYKLWVSGGDAQQKRIYGTRDKNLGHIYWTIQSDPNGTECDKIIILDPYWGLSSESTFTTWSSDEDMKPTALEFVDTNLVRGDSRGYSLIHKDDIYTDPVIDITAPTPDSWITKAVIYDYRSCAFAFGSEVIRKYVTKLLTICKNITNLSLQPQSINDDSFVGKDLKEIRFRSNVTWGDITLIWGDPDISWDYKGLIMASRRFPAGSLRSTYKQIGYTNSNTMIIKSDDYCEGTISRTLKTVTLNDAINNSWPSDLVGFSIYFNNDDYTQGFQISEQTSDTLTVFDPLSVIPLDGSYKWEIKGPAKYERFELESFSIDYDLFGKSQTPYRTGDDDSNA